jgi:hypothetical protein
VDLVDLLSEALLDLLSEVLVDSLAEEVDLVD